MNSIPASAVKQMLSNGALKLSDNTIVAGAIGIDVMGMRETLERKGKAFVILELLQNGWDTDATEVDVRLSKPNGTATSVLKCKDNSPGGYQDLSHAYTLYARSAKKTDPEARGRFNIGEKHVLVMCDKAKISSTSGTVEFDLLNNTHTLTNDKTKVGSEFVGEMAMTAEDWAEIVKTVNTAIPPIPTKLNGRLIPSRTPIRTFKATLSTEVADASTKGVMRKRQRECEVRLYAVLEDETAHVYERGIPVADIHTPWHVDVQQKIPQTLERDGISPAYEKDLYAAVYNEMHKTMSTTEGDTTQPWVSIALETKKLTSEAVQTIITNRFGDKAVSYDPSDKGSNKEAVAQGGKIVHGGTFSGKAWEAIHEAKKADGTPVLPPAGQLFPTGTKIADQNVIDPKDYTKNMRRFAHLIEDVSPLLISMAVKVRVIDEEDSKINGCTQWRKASYVFTINSRYHDGDDWYRNYYLLAHELAHFLLQENDHMASGFHQSVALIGSKLIQLALAQPRLFEGIPQPTPVPFPQYEARSMEAEY